MACHAEPVVGSGAVSVVTTCQRVEEPCGTCRRKWSRVVAITVAYQGVVEPHGIRRRKWSRVVAITVACQGVQACRSKLD